MNIHHRWKKKKNKRAPVPFLSFFFPSNLVQNLIHIQQRINNINNINKQINKKNRQNEIVTLKMDNLT